MQATHAVLPAQMPARSLVLPLPVLDPGALLTVECGACAAPILYELYPDEFTLTRPLGIQCWRCGLWGVLDDGD